MIAMAALFAATVCFADKKPMAFTGDGGLRAFQMDVTVNNRIRVTNCTKDWLSPSEYAKYAAVVIEGGLAKARKETTLWNAPEDLAAVKAYVEGGGVIVAAGWAGNHLAQNNPGAAALFGVKSFHGGGRFALGARLAGQSKMLPWGEALSCVASGLQPSAEALAEAEFKDGHKGIVATRNVVGKGAVY